MSHTYTTAEGDMVDEICHRIYGRSEGTTEAVYAANPGLADLGPVLPVGVVITLPDLSVAKTVKSVRLWD